MRPGQHLWLAGGPLQEMPPLKKCFIRCNILHGLTNKVDSSFLLQETTLSTSSDTSQFSRLVFLLIMLRLYAHKLETVAVYLQAHQEINVD